MLMPGDRRPTEIDPQRRTWPQVHARLALVESGGPQPAISRSIRAGTVFWVTGAARPGLPAVLRASGALRYVVAPGREDARHGAFTVAGCVGRLARSRAPQPLGTVA
jgi:hypothetical protein